jgi:hypothetical protein
VDEAAVAGEFRFGNAEARRFGKEAHGRLRLLHGKEGGAHSGLHPPVPRRHFFGAGEEGQSRLRIAKLERGLAGAGQGMEAARLVGKRAQVAGERDAGILPIGPLLLELRGGGSRGERTCRPQQGKTQPQPFILMEIIAPISLIRALPAMYHRLLPSQAGAADG